jgi:hypothetical protein
VRSLDRATEFDLFDETQSSGPLNPYFLFIPASDRHQSTCNDEINEAKQQKDTMCSPSDVAVKVEEMGEDAFIVVHARDHLSVWSLRTGRHRWLLYHQCDSVALIPAPDTQTPWSTSYLCAWSDVHVSIWNTATWHLVTRIRVGAHVDAIKYKTIRDNLCVTFHQRRSEPRYEQATAQLRQCGWTLAQRKWNQV